LPKWVLALAILLTLLPASAAAEEADIPAIVAEAFGPDLADKALRVVHCESRFDPYATAEGFDRRYGYYRYLGLFQIDPNLHTYRAHRMFGPEASLYDPRVNAHVAAEIWHEYGWGAWPYCGRM
jgi:soluble lytic murein transglycosylase-like protein